jgi:transcriptional regulator with XRE-family HTH domain
MEDDYDERPTRPNGLAVRRRRHEQKQSRRELVEAIGEASRRASGIRETITPNLLSGIEEQNEVVPYKTLYLLANGLDCDPVDLVLEVL